MHPPANHKALLVWKKSIALASKIYAATRTFPDHERHGLSSQMQRSALTIASSIAEGSGRHRRGEYIQCLKIARGCLSELEAQICVTANLQMVDRSLHLEEDVAEIDRLLVALITKLREPPAFETRLSR